VTNGPREDVLVLGFPPIFHSLASQHWGSCLGTSERALSTPSRRCSAYGGPDPNPDVILGALSLVIWTLTIVTTVRYVAVAMRVDNDGEGGILVLMALLGVKRQQRPAIVAVDCSERP
jgi:K+ transporter